MNKFFMAVILFFALSPLFSQNIQAPVLDKGNTSIAMLNYLAAETRAIVSSSNSRLVLEDTYDKLINNINPAIVDEKTQEYLETMLDRIGNFRILSLQRERLHYLFENQQALLFEESLPNPLYLLALRAKNPLSVLVSTALMTADSLAKHQSAKNNAELNLLKGNWELDDKESQELYALRLRAFDYMVETARNNNLDMTDTLSERAIDSLVSCTKDENLQRRRQVLERSRALYAKYAPYWLVLADTYYDLGLYRECLDATAGYETVCAPVVRKDRDFAQVLPKVIDAVSQVHGTSRTYLDLSRTYLEKLIAHTAETDWALRYFAAQAYISMAGTSRREENLYAAYEILLDNVTCLSREQEALLEKYARPIDERIPEGTSKEKEALMKKIISELKKIRRTELPPMHEGLRLNYLTLFELMRERNVSEQERFRVNAIVDKAFVNKIMRQKYFGEKYEMSIGSLELNKYNIRLYNVPVVCVSPLRAAVKITEINDGTETVIFQDEDAHCDPIYNVSRPKSGVIDDFTITLDIDFSQTNDYKLRKEKAYRVYITLSDKDFVYPMIFEKKAGTGHILGDFGLVPAGHS